jgi:5-methylcytosine-specific restriction protein A
VTGTDPRLTTVAWRRLRLAVLDRDGWQCQIRGPRCTTVATAVDHIVARADGGDCWNPHNLRAACRVCNNQGGAEVTNRRRGWAYRNSVATYTTRM